MRKNLNTIASQINGNPLVAAQVQVQNYPIGTPALIYSTDALTSPISPPTLTVAADGSFPFYAPNGHYQYLITPVGGAPYTVRDDLFEDDAAIGYASLAALAAPSGSSLVGGTWFGGVVATVAALATSVGASLLGFIQEDAGSVATTVQAKLRTIKTISDLLPANYVTDGSVDYTLYLQTAINNLGSSGGIINLLNYTIQYSNLTTPTNSIAPIALMGVGAVLKKNSATGTGLLIQGAAGAGGPAGVRRLGCLVQGIRFTHSVVQTAGETIKVVNSEHTSLKNIRIESAYGGILVQDCFDISIADDTYIRASVSYDIKLQGTGASQSCIDTTLDGIIGEGVSGNITKIGLIIDSGVSGVYGSNCDFAQGLNGISIVNTVGGGVRPEYIFMTNVLSDTTYGNGWDIVGDCKGIFLTNCWGATAGGSGNGNGFNIATAIGVHLNNCEAIGNYNHGVNVAGPGGEVHINGGLFSGNSITLANTYSGIKFAVGVGSFSVRNVRSGNLTGLGGGTQKYGIEITTGASDNYSLLSNDVRGNGTAGIIDGGTGTTKRIHDNPGFNPIGYSAVVAIPATTVAVMNPKGIDASVYIIGNSTTVIELNVGTGWVTTGVITGLVRVTAAMQIRLTYAGAAPTWTWFYD